MMEKIKHTTLLFDFYGPLLTEKQQRVINLYYENDFSFTEIAEQLNISRQAVYDLLKTWSKSFPGPSKNCKRFILC